MCKSMPLFLRLEHGHVLVKHIQTEGVNKAYITQSSRNKKLAMESYIMARPSKNEEAVV